VKAITFPATLACGSCGYGLYPEPLGLMADSVVVACRHYGCPERDVRYLLPGSTVELEKADAVQV
jgi:hypothetical protein